MFFGLFRRRENIGDVQFPRLLQIIREADEKRRQPGWTPRPTPPYFPGMWMDQPDTAWEPWHGGDMPVMTPVRKTNGYGFPGIVVAAFKNTKGEHRFVVECTALGVEGMLHIFNRNQLEIDRSPSAETLLRIEKMRVDATAKTQAMLKTGATGALEKIRQIAEEMERGTGGSDAMTKFHQIKGIADLVLGSVK